MRLDDQRESSNFETQSGRGGLGFGGGGGLGGGGLGLILQLVASRFGIVGILVLALGYCALSSLGGLGGGGGVLPGSPSTSVSAPGAATSNIDPATGQFLRRVLGSTEDTWTKLFAANGKQYHPTTLVSYSGSGQSGCGAAQSAMGPFYCPTDKRIYLDATFFDELSQRFQAPGDFAMAYVVAHEVGHHVQDELGVLDQAHNAQASAGESRGNAIQVGVELQADCFAGVWAATARDSKGQALMEPGDVEEGLRAAQAIGDDTLQRQTQGRVVPDSFTHGSSAQRTAALRKGLTTGDPAQCTNLG